MKILVLGDLATGKTTLTQRFIQNVFPRPENHTFLDHDIVNIDTSEGEKVKTLVMDTYGQEKYLGVNFNLGCFRGAQGAILVYDVTNR